MLIFDKNQPLKEINNFLKMRKTLAEYTNDLLNSSLLFNSQNLTYKLRIIFL